MIYLDQSSCFLCSARIELPVEVFSPPQVLPSDACNLSMITAWHGSKVCYSKVVKA